MLFRSSAIVCSILFLAGTNAACAQLTTISGLFTTGVDSLSAPLADMQSDPHYVVTASTLGATYTGDSYTVKNGKHGTGWTSNTSAAKWIVGEKPGGNDGVDPDRPVGTFDYTLTFDLPTGAQVWAVSITGTGAADDSAAIYVNGTLVSGQTLSGYSSTNAFTLNSSNATFLNYGNTLTFRVNNTAIGPTGLLVTGLSGTAMVPEVGAFLPVAGALALMAGIKVRRRLLTKRQPTPTGPRAPSARLRE